MIVNNTKKDNHYNVHLIHCPRVFTKLSLKAIFVKSEATMNYSDQSTGNLAHEANKSFLESRTQLTDTNIL